MGPKTCCALWRAGRNSEVVTCEPTSILDTAELRWFVHGQLPQRVAQWFTGGGAAGRLQERSDLYRLDRRDDVGVKQRFEKTLELKQRCSVDGALALQPNLCGPVEHWRRWSPAFGMVARHEDEAWIRVYKAIIKRRFSPDGVELPVVPSLPEGGGCDIEVTALDVEGVHAWSLALSSFGAWQNRTHNLTTAWQALVNAAGPLPIEAGIPAQAACGYPAWLRQLVADDVVGADTSHTTAA